MTTDTPDDTTTYQVDERLDQNPRAETRVSNHEDWNELYHITKEIEDQETLITKSKERQFELLVWLCGHPGTGSREEASRIIGVRSITLRKWLKDINPSDYPKPPGETSEQWQWVALTDVSNQIRDQEKIKREAREQQLHYLACVCRHPKPTDMTDAADIVGYSTQTIRTWLDKAGLYEPNPYLSEMRKAERLNSGTARDGERDEHGPSRTHQKTDR